MAAEAIDLFIKLVIVLGSRIHYFITKTAIIAWSKFAILHCKKIFLFNYVVFVYLVCINVYEGMT